MEVDTHGNLHRKERAGKVERNEDEGQLSQASDCSPLYDCSLTFRDRHRGHQSMERSIYAHFDGLQAVGQGGASLVNLLRFFIVELNVVRGGCGSNTSPTLRSGFHSAASFRGSFDIRIGARAISKPICL
jgi:hypothetical protein